MLFLSHFGQDFGDLCGYECRVSDICHVYLFRVQIVSAEFVLNITYNK